MVIRCMSRMSATIWLWAMRVPADRLQGPRARGRVEPLVEQVGPAHDRVQRRAQLVRERRQELVLEAARLVQLLDAPLQLSVRPPDLDVAPLQRVQHLVERGHQGPDLVPARARHADRLVLLVLLVRDPSRHAGEVEHGPRDRPAEAHDDQHRDPQRAQRDRGHDHEVRARALVPLDQVGVQDQRAQRPVLEHDRPADDHLAGVDALRARPRGRAGRPRPPAAARSARRACRRLRTRRRPRHADPSAGPPGSWPPSRDRGRRSRSRCCRPGCRRRRAGAAASCPRRSPGRRSRARGPRRAVRSRWPGR